MRQISTLNLDRRNKCENHTLHHDLNVFQLCQMQVLGRTIIQISYIQTMTIKNMTNVPGKRNKSTGSFACITVPKRSLKWLLIMPIRIIRKYIKWKSSLQESEKFETK